MKKFLSICFLIFCVTLTCAVISACNYSESERQKTVQKTETICGKIYITYEDGTEEVKDTFSDAGHDWDDGVITTAPTCSTIGIKTYTCKICTEKKKELLDADGEHKYGDYAKDSKYHWVSCELCGEKLGGGTQHLLSDWENYTDYKYRDTATVIGLVEKRGCEVCGFTQIRASSALGYKFSGWSNGLHEPIQSFTNERESVDIMAEFVTDTLNVPVFYVDTYQSSVIDSKENYVQCSVSVINAEEEYCIDSASAGIRLRGNSTSTYPKKPYRIKFDKKQGLFGWEKNKSWVLLALYQDFSNIKDYAAFAIADSISNETSAFVPHAKHVELYLNGEYIGLYLLTDQVQENSGRTDVEEEFGEEDIEVPFLVEWDEYAPGEGKEGIDWFKIENKDTGVTSYYNIKYPEAEQRYTQEQFEYIQNYIERVNTLCHDSETTREQFEELVDLPSFIDYYMVQEIMGQGEINWKSIYMSKKTDGKLKMGPIWDFDWAAGGPIMFDEYWIPDPFLISSTNWFAFMLKKEWFKTEFLLRVESATDPILRTIDILKLYKNGIRNVSERNAILWHFDLEDKKLPSFGVHYDFVIDFIKMRLKGIRNI